MATAAPALPLDKTMETLAGERVTELKGGRVSMGDKKLPMGDMQTCGTILEMIPRNTRTGLTLEGVNAHWPQHETFCQLVGAWRIEHAPKGQKKAPLDPIADGLGVSVGYLRQIILPNSKKVPSLEMRLAASEFFCVPLNLLVDEKHAAIPGIPQPELLSPTKRLAAQRILAVLNDPNLPDDVAIDMANYLRNTVEFSIRVKQRLG